MKKKKVTDNDFCSLEPHEIRHMKRYHKMPEDVYRSLVKKHNHSRKYIIAEWEIMNDEIVNNPGE